MRISDIKTLLSCRCFAGESELDIKVKNVYAADMMSDVLKSCKTGSLLITGLINPQIIHVAEILDLKGIVLVSGKEPGNEITEKAMARNLPVLTTDKPMFEACGIIFDNWIKEKDSVKKNNGETGNTVQSFVSDNR